MYYTLYSAHILALLQRTTTTLTSSDYVLHTNDRLQPKKKRHTFSADHMCVTKTTKKEDSRKMASHARTRSNQCTVARARVHAHPELQSLWCVIYLECTHSFGARSNNTHTHTHRVLNVVERKSSLFFRFCSA